MHPSPQPRTLAIEGPTGSGKSTLASQLARHLGYTVIKTPPAPFSEIRDRVENECGEEVRLLFNRSGLAHASDLARADQSASFLFDRYACSTFLYAGRSPDDMRRSLGVEFIEPDQWIFLRASEAVRQRRLVSRDSDSLSRFRQRANEIGWAQFLPFVEALPAERVEVISVDLLNSNELADRVAAWLTS